ncbi:MAG: hypothetical protein E7583_03505 [Ruminococcaceae bacterium]|nr:hypothetical protein [Oscillospiraceae bacterium]
MYLDLGKTLKKIAGVIKTIGMIVGVIYAIFLFASYDGDTALLGWCILLLAPIVSWLAGMSVYYLGEFIDRVTGIELNTRTAAGDSIDHFRIKQLDILVESELITPEEYKQALSIAGCKEDERLK